MEFITNQTNKIFSNAIKKYGKQRKADFVSIVFSLDEKNELVYRVGYDHVPELFVTFMEILGVKFDIRGYSVFVPPAIKTILTNFQKEFNTKDVVVCVYANQEDDTEVNYYVFADDERKREFKLADVLELDFEQINE